jgi:hypothetical protein
VKEEDGELKRQEMGREGGAKWERTDVRGGGGEGGGEGAEDGNGATERDSNEGARKGLAQAWRV